MATIHNSNIKIIIFFCGILLYINTESIYEHLIKNNTYLGLIFDEYVHNDHGNSVKKTVNILKKIIANDNIVKYTKSIINEEFTQKCKAILDNIIDNVNR